MRHFQMHDLATQDLALRMGGTKTGLLNASLVNIYYTFPMYQYADVRLAL